MHRAEPPPLPPINPAEIAERDAIALWRAVLLQAARDAAAGGMLGDVVSAWMSTSDFTWICDAAHIAPDFARQMIRSIAYDPRTRRRFYNPRRAKAVAETEPAIG